MNYLLSFFFSLSFAYPREKVSMPSTFNDFEKLWEEQCVQIRDFGLLKNLEEVFYNVWTGGSYRNMDCLFSDTDPEDKSMFYIYLSYQLLFELTNESAFFHLKNKQTLYRGIKIDPEMDMNNFTNTLLPRMKERITATSTSRQLAETFMGHTLGVLFIFHLGIGHPCFIIGGKLSIRVKEEQEVLLGPNEWKIKDTKKVEYKESIFYEISLVSSTTVECPRKLSIEEKTSKIKNILSELLMEPQNESPVPSPSKVLSYYKEYPPKDEKAREEFLCALRQVSFRDIVKGSSNNNHSANALSSLQAKWYHMYSLAQKMEEKVLLDKNNWVARKNEDEFKWFTLSLPIYYYRVETETAESVYRINCSKSRVFVFETLEEIKLYFNVIFTWVTKRVVDDTYNWIANEAFISFCKYWDIKAVFCNEVQRLYTVPNSGIAQKVNL